MALQNIEHVPDHSLQLDEDIQGFKRGLLPQRIGMVVIALLLIIGACGLFGTGPLSIITERATSTTVRYEQYLRFENITELEVKIKSADGATRITFPQSYLNELHVERIQPEPASSEIVNGSVIYTFPQTDDGEIMFFIGPQKAGTIEGEMHVNNDVIKLSHFVYP